MDHLRFSTPASQLALKLLGPEVQERLGWGTLVASLPGFSQWKLSSGPNHYFFSHLKLSKSTQWMEMTQEFGHGLFVFATLRKV